MLGALVLGGVGPALAALPPASASPTAAVEVPSIVVLREGASAAAVADAADVDPTSTYQRAIDGFAADLTSAEILRLRRNPLVKRIVPDETGRVVQPAQVGPPTKAKSGLVAADPTAPGGLAGTVAAVQAAVQELLVSLGLAAPAPPPQVTPTAVQRVGAVSSPTARIDSIDERVDATIALVDTGIERHPDLNLVGGVDCVDGGSGGYDVDAYRNGTDHAVGHGTLVAGVAAAVDDTSGVVGVAPGARLLSAKAVDADGASSTGALLCALDWAMQPEQHTDVINISLGWYDGRFGASSAPCGTDEVDPIHEAICGAVEQGFTVVVAAGNDGRDAAGRVGEYPAHYPAAYPEVFTVSMIVDFDGLPGGQAASAPACGQSQLDDHLRTTSNFGAPVDMAAVGLCVLTTGLAGSLVTTGGTSLAAPAVSGGVALLRAAAAHVLTPAQARARLLADAEPGPIPGDPDDYPEGVLRVAGF